MVNKKNATTAGSLTGASVAKLLGEFQKRDTARQIEIDRLSGMVQQLTQVSSIECILTNGFQELSDKLAPLEDLTPKRDALSPRQAARMKRLMRAMARPDWSGATSLPVPNWRADIWGAADVPTATGGMAS